MDVTDNNFARIETAARAGGPLAAVDELIDTYRQEQQYGPLFDALLMKARLSLGMPLIQSSNNNGTDTPPAYEEALRSAAREVGTLFLETGEIARAWQYFRALGDAEPVAKALQELPLEQATEEVIDLALREGVHLRRGFEMVMAQFGTCRAITLYGQLPSGEERRECGRLLVRTLHHEIAEALKRAITAQEGTAPDTEHLPELINGRDWLFGEYDYYVDTSHLFSVVQYSAELPDAESLDLAIELTDYGRKLSKQFQYRGEEPFEDPYVDYGYFLRGMRGKDVDAALAHFRGKLSPEQPISAQVMVQLLVRAKRYAEAVDVAREYLAEARPGQLLCPSLPELCVMAGDFQPLRETAREQDDLLWFTAAVVASEGSEPVQSSP